jgi:NADH:ubiquinone reductase (non-electrogenic)
MWARQLASVTKTARSNSSAWWKRTASSLDPASRMDEVKKPENFQLVIVGTGWAGYQMFTQCRKHLVDIEENVGRPVDLVVISKRNVRSSPVPARRRIRD